jgi:site-specific recombinase XerD
VAWRLGHLPTEDYHRAVDLQAVRDETLPKGRAIGPGESRALFVACSRRGASGARDASLLAVLHSAGLRRAEAVALDLEDYDAESGALKVRGKGNKQRMCYASNGANAAKCRDKRPLRCCTFRYKFLVNLSKS